VTAEVLKAEIAVEFDFEWDRMREGLDQVTAILAAFQSRVAAHLGEL